MKINLLGPLDLGDLDRTRCAGSSSSSWSTWPVTTTGTCASGRSRSAFARSSSGRPEIAEKTLRNYLSELRQWVGAEHLPESSAKEGYLLHDVELDWATFLRLSRQADASGGAEAIALRTEALALVRGRPFEGLLDDGFEWVEAEHLDSQMAGRHRRVRGPPGQRPPRGEGLRRRAEQAAWAGRRGAPEDSGPWLVGAQAISAQGDRSALNRWMKDASRHLDPEDIARIWQSLGPDHDPSSKVGEGEGPQGGLGPAALHAHGVVRAAEDLGHLGQRPSLDAGSRPRGRPVRAVTTPAATAAASSPGQRSRGSFVGGGDVEVFGQWVDRRARRGGGARRPGGPRSRWHWPGRPADVGRRRPRRPETTSQATASVSASASSGSAPRRTRWRQIDSSSGSRSASRLMAARWSQPGPLGQRGDAGLRVVRTAVLPIRPRIEPGLARACRSSGSGSLIGCRRRSVDNRWTADFSCGVVMAPSRQTGFRKWFLEGFPKVFPTGNFFAAFSLVMDLGTDLGTLLGHGWGTSRAASWSRRASRSASAWA